MKTHQKYVTVLKLVKWWKILYNRCREISCDAMGLSKIWHQIV